MREEKNDIFFIYDKKLIPEELKKTKIPFKFISFAKIEGKLYHYYTSRVNNELYKRNYFAVENKDAMGIRFNQYVYGALFQITNNLNFHAYNLDSFYSCSLFRLNHNHKDDLMHRRMVEAIPIHFNDIEQFCRLRYEEEEPIICNAYYGNIDNIHIKKRIYHKAHITYRILSGLNTEGFLALYQRIKYNK